MATDEELYKIIVKTQGEADVERLSAAIRKEQDAIRLLTAELRLGAISQAQFDASAKKAAASISQSTQEMKKFQRASASGATQGLTQLGYTLDDLQYGFKGIANNIQPLLSTIPQLAKIAPVIAIVSTAAFQLYEHWDQLAGLFGQSKVKTQTEEMEELGKKTKKTADETERLARAENLRSTAETLAKGKTAAEQASDSAVTAAVGEAGFGQVIAGLQANAPNLVNDQGDALVAREKLEKLLYGGLGNKHVPGTGATFNKSLDEPQVKAERLRLEKELADARNLTAQGKIAQAANSGDWGAVPLDQLIAAVEKDPSKFGGKKKGGALLTSLKEAAKTPQEREDQQGRRRRPTAGIQQE
jgi:hypothetical protein